MIPPRKYWATVPTIELEPGIGKAIRQWFNIDRRKGDADDRQQQAFSDTMKILNGDGWREQFIVIQWIDHPYKSSLRYAVSKLVGRDSKRELDKILHRSSTFTKEELRHLGSESYEEKINKMHESHEDIQRGYERAQAELYLEDVMRIATVSQTLIPRDKIRLYRGVHGFQAQAISDRALRVKEVRISTDQTTSFTSSTTLASDFAYGMTVKTKQPRFGLIFYVDVPRTSIVASPDACYDLEYEREFIVATHGRIIVPSNQIDVVLAG